MGHFGVEKVKKRGQNGGFETRKGRKGPEKDPEGY